MKHLRRYFIISTLGCLLLLVGLLYVSYITDPYSTPTIIHSPFRITQSKNGNFALEQIEQIAFTQNPVIKTFANSNKDSRFVLFLFQPEIAEEGSENTIIAAIHQKSFDPQRPYIISGSHFADMYARNAGIFYNAVLDNRFALSKKDWENRQKSYLESIALHLTLLKQAGHEYTTFIPVAGSLYTASNVYTQPSDSLFGLLYGLSALKDDTFIHTLYKSNSTFSYPLQTRDAAMKLLSDNHDVLKTIIGTYYNSVVDPRTGLVRTNITLSSARDGIKRQSSFYDNVIVWASVKMAHDLGIMNSPVDLEAWKAKIIASFWDEQHGLFLDDLSSESRKEKVFSADSFIVLGSGFFDLMNKEDKRKLTRMVLYVKKNHLDEPFPLRYSLKDQPSKLYTQVKLFAPSYMGETIWSHWGMEYIKALILLSKDNPGYLSDAAKDLQAYKRNIEKYGGYPELYDLRGNIYKTPFYTSVLLTSWVVNYEQAKMLYLALR